MDSLIFSNLFKMIPEDIVVDFKTASPAEKESIVQILIGHYTKLVNEFGAKSDYASTTGYWSGHTPISKTILTAKKFIARYGKYAGIKLIPIIVKTVIERAEEFVAVKTRAVREVKLTTLAGVTVIVNLPLKQWNFATEFFQNWQIVIRKARTK